MDDGLKLSKDKRHRSSSSLAGAVLDGTRSERKLDMKASIPEMDDQFATAEVRCDDLQEKIELIKSLKRKRKLKKRSMTKVTDPPMTPESVPFITVRTQPKKTLLITEVSQQAARLRRLEVPPNPTRGYLDPATVEQHRMIGQVRGYNQTFKPQQESYGQIPLPTMDRRLFSKLRRQISQADGDSMGGRSHPPTEGLEVACGQDDTIEEYSNFDVFSQAPDYPVVTPKKPTDLRHMKQTSRRRHVPKETISKEGGTDQVFESWQAGAQGELPIPRPRRHTTRSHQSTGIDEMTINDKGEDRPVVELFNKSRHNPGDARRLAAAAPPPAPLASHATHEPQKRTKKVRNSKYDDDTAQIEDILQEPKKINHEGSHHPRRIKYRSRRYELPTVASQMKQAGMRYYYGTSNHTNIPFVVSKSTAPSHNIGVNIQQVLNGLKIQQPLSGIPLTIAHHMGLGHVPTYGAKSTVVEPSLDHREINAIRVGQRLLRLPSYKYMSYNRLLTLYREGDGMVPRFLRAISRPHYFYTSMYNLATNREDFDGATSKGGRGGSQEAKQSLAEYASLYREYEQVDKCIKEGNFEPELERRRNELTKELAAREEHIRRVVQEYRTGGEGDPILRASASTAEEGYRHSSFKLGDTQQ
ncbi:uncharacterized protein LOC118267168 isoform X2 [Spodoptera frugiperda]|uniref:Uncharacterized protein LOC118267168 isoform X2 n=1 Tax=Spodoptera frugiperda TaxID=7108 RepID=A0A9R0EIZ3_SPOFR|nr:uncharacterized protein LOC118267168 isoform X2 [Spodoptera frugiperda]